MPSLLVTYPISTQSINQSINQSITQSLTRLFQFNVDAELVGDVSHIWPLRVAVLGRHKGFGAFRQFAQVVASVSLESVLELAHRLRERRKLRQAFLKERTDQS